MEINKNNVFESDAAEKKDGNSPLGEKSKKKPRKNIIMTFVLSLLASVTMWIVAVDYEEVDYQKSFTGINVEIIGEDQTGMQIELDDGFRLDITVSGKRSQLSTLKASSFTAVVDVSSVNKEGKSDPLQVEIEPINGIKVVSQSMTHLTVMAEKRITDTFEVVPLLGMAQLENGVNYSLICDTQVVTVTGSERVIKSIKRAVAYVNPEPKNITESFKSNCQIVLESDMDIDLSKVNISPYYCGVEVVLTKEKSVPVKVCLEGGGPMEYNASFHPAVTSVLISGEPKNVDAVDSICLNIPYEKITNQLGSGKNSFTVKGTLVYPENVVGENAEAQVDVRVDVSTKVETVSGNDVVINGCPLGYTVLASDVEVKLTGLYEEMETIKSSSITVFLNLENVAPSKQEQRVKGTVIIENPYGTIYETQCFVTVKFLNTVA